MDQKQNAGIAFGLWAIVVTVTVSIDVMYSIIPGWAGIIIGGLLTAGLLGYASSSMLTHYVKNIDMAGRDK